MLIGCENLYQEDGPPRIRSQGDVDAYNATVSSEGQKLVCSREVVLGTNMRQFVCMTVAQRDRIQRDAQDNVSTLNSALDAAPPTIQ